MNVLHVIESLDPESGGPPMVVARLAAAQSMQGHTVKILSAPRPEATDRIARAINSVPALSTVQHVHLPPGSFHQWLPSKSNRHIIRETVATVDAVHLHGVWEPLFPHIARIARQRRVAYVVRPCGMLDPWSLRQSKWKKKLALMLTHRSMLNSATFIHALNADERDLIGPLRICAPIEVIPNGIFLEEVRSAITSGQDETTALPEAPYILFLSRLHYKKGLDILAEAFIWVAKQHPNVNLVVAGPDQGARNDLVTRIEAAGLSSRVQVVGPLYGADKYRAMSRCLCFCLPSRQEGFSVAILEALSVGAPAVISNECHFPEVGELSAGIVTKLDSESVAEALNHLLGNQALREAMATNARALVENRFTWQKVADLTLNAYLRRSK